MAFPFRAIRAAGTALFVAAAVGSGGMVGMTSALAVDPTTVGLAGIVVDAGGVPLPGVHLTIAEELPPDGGAAAFPALTGSDGSFGADINAWGTAAAPASLTIETPAEETILRVVDTCTQTWGVEVALNLELALAVAAPDPLSVTATTKLLGEVCGTIASPPPNDGGTGSGSGPGSGSGGGAQMTPPPTDVAAGWSVETGDRIVPALAIGFVVGILVAALLRPRLRARDRP